MTVDNLPPNKRIGAGLTMLFLIGAVTAPEQKWIAQLIVENWSHRPRASGETFINLETER